MIRSFKHFNTIYENIEFYRNIKEKNKNIVESIKEGLIYSWSYNIFKNKLKDLLNSIKEFDVNILLNNHYIELEINIKNEINFLEKIKNILNQSGYLISNWKYKNEKEFRTSDLPEKLNFKNKNLILRFNKKYDLEEKGVRYKMYHITNIRLLNKIIKKGILPRNNNVLEKHEERIYLFDNIESANLYLDDKNTNKTIKDIDKISDLMDEDFFIILEVDLRLVRRIKLYKDPKFNEQDGAYYTEDSIPPICIKVL